MKIVAVSDIHGKWNKLKIPECDVLISAGDYSFTGERHIVRNYHEWLNEQPATHIISGQGNHEVWVENNFEEAKQIALTACPRAFFVEEGGITIDDINFWYSAITPWFHDWAYNRRAGRDIEEHWKKIPENTNVLITHGPPYGILDTVPFPDGTPKERVGCWTLNAYIERIKPDIHIFGHIHHSHGQKHENGISYYNVSVCDEQYVPSNGITVIDYIKEEGS